MRFIVLLTFVSSLYAQTVSGNLSGNVTDPGGVGFAGATLQLKNPVSGAEYKTTSAAKGAYTIGELPSGTYDVSVTAPGLRPFQQKGVAIQAGQTLKLDIRLAETNQLSTLGEDPAAIAYDNRRLPPSGATPRTHDGKPDLTGVWRRARVIDPGKPEFLAWAEPIAKQRAEKFFNENPFSRCLPPSPIRLPAWFKFIQAPTALVMILDDDTPGFRQIFMDGRGHPKDVNPTWTGHAIGRWEGDTLVVDKVGFNDKTWLDNDGHPHTEMLHIIERYRRPDKGHLEMETTVEDPGTLAKPWTQKRIADLAPGDEEVLEFICNENNRDPDHMVGK